MYNIPILPISDNISLINEKLHKFVNKNCLWCHLVKSSSDTAFYTFIPHNDVVLT